MSILAGPILDDTAPLCCYVLEAEENMSSMALYAHRMGALCSTKGTGAG